MGHRLKQSPRVRTRVSVRTALAYGAAGLLAGASLCTGLLYIDKHHEPALRYTDTVVQQPLTVCPGESVQLLPESIRGDVFRWSPADGLSDAASPNPHAAPKQTTVYTVSVYSKTETLISAGDRFAITAAAISGKLKDKMLWRRVVNAPAGPCLLTMQSRTTAFLDKAVLQLRINNKPAATYEARSATGRVQEIVWHNATAGPVTISLHLVDYDGDGEAIDCSRLEMHALHQTDVQTEIRVSKECRGCDMPATPRVVNTGLREVKLQWKKTPANVMLVRFRDTQEAHWQYQPMKGKTTMLKDLAPDRDYVVQAAALCRQDTSSWCAAITLRAVDRQLMSSWTEGQR